MGGDESSDLRNLPEPAEFHAALARRHPLNWGDPLPTKIGLAA